MVAIAITGTGAMENYEVYGAPWYSQNTTITSVQISEGVTSIGSYAFDRCFNLANVNIPNSVTIIENNAFSYNRWALTDIEIPSNVTKIGREAFSTCDKLTNITIPESVTDIGELAFIGCHSLTDVIIPSSVTNIEYGTFASCTGLINITIPSSVIKIGGRAFSGCTNLTSITIPASVTQIEYEAFTGCNNLAAIQVASNNQAYVSVDGVLFTQAMDGLIAYPAKKGGDYIIPSSVTYICDYAFDECAGLTSVTIPNSITSIGDGAFAGCSGLTSIAVPNSVTSILSATFRSCDRLASITIPNSITMIGSYAFQDCTKLKDIFFAGTEVQWKAIKINTTDNNYFLDATVHYNSTGPDDVGPDNMNSVYFLSGWDATTRTVRFGDSTLISPHTYTVADSVDVSNISSLLNKYVLVKMEQGDSSLEYTITDIQPVESRIGTVSTTGEHSLTIDGITYPVREDYVLASYDGEEVLYHTYNGTIMGFDVLKAKTGMLEAWDATTGKATIDGKTYVTNYLSDLSLMSNADNVIGKKIEFSVVDSFDYYPALSFSFCPGFYFSSNAPTNSIERGSTFDLYVGYYFDDGSLDSKSKEFVSVVSDNKIVEIVPDGWSDKYGQHYTAKANSAGNATFTVTNSRNNDAASLNLYVIEKEYGYNFDNVPKLTYEEGKVTNFYNHNGLVVDEFAYTPHKNASGEIDYYVVTMNVYNTLDLYGAVTAYNADGNPTGFYLIDKKEVFQSNLTNTYNELLLEIGDLFYLIGNEKFYSGESISKKTTVSINVPVGGYLEISNSIYSDVALIANITGLLIDGLKSAKGIFDSSFDFDGLISQKTAVIHDVISKDFVGEKINSAIKGVALDDLKNANWNLDNYGECLQTFLNHLSDLGINLMDSISSSIFTLTGFRNISESVLMKIVPTGNLINFLYDIMGIGDQAVTWITFQKSTDFANGIYIYAPSTGKSYSSNGISVIPASSAVESNVVLHSYLVVDETEIPSNTFNGDAETYSITMYKGGKETQPNTTITVRIPLSEKFKGLDKSVIKVYRHNDDGTTTNMNATIVDGYAVFETNHLSYYSIVAETNLPNPVTYTVVFNPNGGTLSGFSALTTSTEGKLSSLPTATRSDYTFDGWFISASGGHKITTDYVFTSDTTVYAHWSKSSASITYAITFDAGGGAVTPNSTSTDEDGKLSTLPTPTRNGYTFDGWFTSASGGNKITTGYVFISDTTIYAHWIKDSGGSSGGGSSSGGDSSSGGSNSTSYSITAGNFTHGSVSISPKSAAKGTKVTLTIQPDNSYKLEELAVIDSKGNKLELTDKGNDKYTFIMPAGSVKVEANFTALETSGIPWVNPFADVAESAWYYSAVRFVNKNALMGGYGNGLFGVNDNLSRAQLAQVLYNKEGRPFANVGNNFTDVGTTVWYSDAVTWAAVQGIVSGYGNGKFGPNDPITREQLAVMLWRYSGSPSATKKELNFSDADEASGYALNALCWTVENGIINGYGNGRLGPKELATRALVAQMLMNYLEH